ncbi:MAG TPA: hypothetical protein PKW33_02690 [Anaerolineaceae bacterium]|nr:hypothetical protein [Anaerolineaceae bacterium]HPN50469.1 hypothetical protein [Anaerolineaceae bacterium]
MKRIFSLVLLACLALSACVPPAGTFQLEPRPAPTSLPAITPVTDTVHLDPGFQEGLAYTTSAELSFEVTQPTGVQATGTITLQRSASGLDFLDTLTASGDAVDDQAFLGQTQMVYRIASQTYYLASDEAYRLGQRERELKPTLMPKPPLCIALTAVNGSLPFNLDALLGGLKLPAEKSEETLDGAKVFRYDLTAAAFPNTRFSSVIARAWLDEQGRIVKMEGEASGLFSLFGEVVRQGHLKWVYTFKTAAPAVIQPPAVNCNAPAADIPLPDDAEILASFQGLINMRTALSVKETADFYRKNVPGGGWFPYGEVDSGSVLKLYFYNRSEYRAILVIIAPDLTSGTNILLTESDIDRLYMGE